MATARAGPPLAESRVVPCAAPPRRSSAILDALRKPGPSNEVAVPVAVGISDHVHSAQLIIFVVAAELHGPQFLQ